MNFNKIIIWLCYCFNRPLPVKMQKIILQTALLHAHRFTGMCAAINESFLLLYNSNLFYKSKNLIPVFSRDNFYKLYGLEDDLPYWCDRWNRYYRLRFLRWCIDNVR